MREREIEPGISVRQINSCEILFHTHQSLSLLSHSLYLPLSLPYPQGVLDLLANRCLSQGTNAWTDVDHTCYTMTTAGSEGFLNLMPIYLDHILYPTLTVSGKSIQSAESKKYG